MKRIILYLTCLVVSGASSGFGIVLLGVPVVEVGFVRVAIGMMMIIIGFAVMQWAGGKVWPE